LFYRSNPILQYLSQGVRRKPAPVKHDPLSFEGVQAMAVEKTVDAALPMLMQWFYGVVSRYPEEKFHMLMQYGMYYDLQGNPQRGFDIFQDLQRNHGVVFSRMVGLAARGIDMVMYNIDDMTHRIVYVLKNHAGWKTIYPHEIMCLNITLHKVDNLIHSRKHVKTLV